ncbi:PAS domain-containing protein [Paenibacillus sp. FA6]|uniref:PAS domain-containing protein n=1 Tax=Paenibacillus sp. FA6 TaxID=3413029 RepID=UPI003F65B7EC
MPNDIATLHNEVIHSLQISVIAIDSAGYIIAINKAWEQLSAYHNIPSHFQWLGVNFFQICDTLSRTQEHDSTIMNSFQCILNGHKHSLTYDFSMILNHTTEWLTLVAYPLFKDETNFIKGAVISVSNITPRKQMELDFHEALSQIRTLRGLIPICAVCKRIKDDDLWNDIECFLEKHTYAEFTHDICPDCIRRLYPKYSSVLDRPPES